MTKSYLLTINNIVSPAVNWLAFNKEMIITKRIQKLISKHINCISYYSWLDPYILITWAVKVVTLMCVCIVNHSILTANNLQFMALNVTGMLWLPWSWDKYEALTLNSCLQTSFYLQYCLGTHFQLHFQTLMVSNDNDEHL